MKDQYYGDVNDYVKYGLLRCLSEAGLRVGVNWMLTPDDGSSDGGKLAYLADDERWRSHDPELYASLRSTVGAGVRRSTLLAENGLIPGARFFRELVPKQSRDRDQWFERSLAALGGQDLMFFDPDRGLEVASSRPGSATASQYLYWSEAERAWQTGASLLIFQYFPREDRAVFTNRLMDRCLAIASDGEVAAIRSSNVLYLLVSQAGHQWRTSDALELARTRWEPRIRC